MMPTYLSSPEELIFQTRKTRNQFGTADPMQVQYMLENDQREDEQKHQMFMQRYTRDLDDAGRMQRMRNGIYDSPDQMLMDPYGPAYERRSAAPERNISIGIGGQPMQSMPTFKRAPRAEFRGAIEAMRPRNFQEVKGTPGNSRYGEDAKMIEILQNAVNGMDPNDPDLPGFQSMLKDRLRVAMRPAGATAETAPVSGGGFPDMLRDIPGLGGLVSLGQQMLTPKQSIMYSEGDAPLTAAAAPAPTETNVSAPAAGLAMPGMGAVNKVANPNGQDIEARIQATMKKFGRSREEVVAALKAKGLV